MLVTSATWLNTEQLLQRGTGLLEDLLVGIEHAIEPWEELLGAVVGVEDDGNAICGGNGADVVGGSDGTGNGCLLATVCNTLTGEVGSTTLGDLSCMSVP